MHVKSLGIAFLFVISGCLMKNNKGGDGNNSNNEQNDPVLTECSSNLKASLSMPGPKEFIEKIEELKGIANSLKVSENSYTLRALKNFSSGDPIGFAKNHCQVGGEIMSLPDENCTMDTKTIDTKEYKKQCSFINNIVSKDNEINKLVVADAEFSKKPNNLTGQLKKLVDEYISLITTNF